MRFSTSESIIKINAYFNLEMPKYCQDWFLECADKNKLSDFLSSYETVFTEEDDKFALMDIILGSFEDLVYENGFNNDIWKKISFWLKKDYRIHEYLITYWCDEKSKPDGFAFSHQMRELKDNII